jgi:hypothetical protein
MPSDILIRVVEDGDSCERRLWFDSWGSTLEAGGKAGGKAGTRRWRPGATTGLAGATTASENGIGEAGLLAGLRSLAATRCT